MKGQAEQDSGGDGIPPPHRWRSPRRDKQNAIKDILKNRLLLAMAVCVLPSMQSNAEDNMIPIRDTAPTGTLAWPGEKTNTWNSYRRHQKHQLAATLPHSPHLHGNKVIPLPHMHQRLARAPILGAIARHESTSAPVKRERG